VDAVTERESRTGETTVETPAPRAKYDSRDEVPPLGFREYWYPGLKSKELKEGKPLALTLLGEQLVVMRSGGAIGVFPDWCPHRGVRLSIGHSRFPGTLSCRYHGMTFDLKTGQCLAMLTDGPQSPIPPQVKLVRYPAEERFGVVWIYMGERQPPPLEEDLPEKILSPKAQVLTRVEVWKCNWRVTLDNAIDSAHVIYLHRSALRAVFRRLAAWQRVRMIEKGKWSSYTIYEKGIQADYPGLGRYPQHLWWRRVLGKGDTGIRLPGVFRSGQGYWEHIRWAVPIDANLTRNFQFAVNDWSGLKRLLFRVYYYVFLRWVFYKNFNGQDILITENVLYDRPEKLAATDVPVVHWRKMARRARAAQSSNVDVD